VHLEWNYVETAMAKLAFSGAIGYGGIPGYDT
jgi:hypothetical protein